MLVARGPFPGCAGPTAFKVGKSDPKPPEEEDELDELPSTLLTSEVEIFELFAFAVALAESEHPPTCVTL